MREIFSFSLICLGLEGNSLFLAVRLHQLQSTEMVIWCCVRSLGGREEWRMFQGYYLSDLDCSEKLSASLHHRKRSLSKASWLHVYLSVSKCMLSHLAWSVT